MIATEALWLGRIVIVALLLSLPKIASADDASAADPPQAEQPAKTDVQALAERVKAMRPKSAGMLLARLPVKLSAAVLLQLTPRTGGRILNYVPSAQAAAIAAEMAGETEEAS